MLRRLIRSQPLSNVIYIFSFYSFFPLAFSLFLSRSRKTQIIEILKYWNTNSCIYSVERLKQICETTKHKHLQPTEIWNVTHYHQQHACNNLGASCPFGGFREKSRASGKSKETRERGPNSLLPTTRGFARAFSWARLKWRTCSLRAIVTIMLTNTTYTAKAKRRTNLP